MLGTGREDHRQGHRDITGKGKGYAASGSEELYIDLSTYTKSFSHLERSPLKQRWDCSCAVLSFSWIADRIGPPVLQSSLLQSGWESVWNIQNTQLNQEPSKEELGMWQEKIGQWGVTKDKIQDDQVIMMSPNTGRWNRRREAESSKQNEKDRLRMLN